MNYDDLADEILDHPSAQKIVNQVQSTLNKEKKARHDFREWLKDDIKAEFINGEIVMHSPVRRGHLNVTENLLRVLSTYVLLHDLGEVSVEKALIALERNDYEPDLVFWTKEQAKDFHDETMVHPVPSLVVEILSKSTKSKDRGIKFKDYGAHHIPEYWIIDYHKQIVEQYILTADSKDEYVLFQKATVGQNIASKIVTDFNIPVAAIFDKQANLVALKGIMR